MEDLVKHLLEKETIEQEEFKQIMSGGFTEGASDKGDNLEIAK